ncbi:Ascorbate-specific phosphotransferase enzyme IIA component [Corynebacterium felinum]|nr:Ascorbate-specific phosphotransferase enzyme IIA component [Corynebacterium felinum]
MGKSVHNWARLAHMSTLSTLLAPTRVLLDAQAHTWQEAITLSGRLLEKDNLATAEYTQAMIDTVIDKGPYIVLAPGFAFAHARPSEAVNTTALSVVRLAQPVTFGHPDNDPVTLIFALCATDSSGHLAAMRHIARILRDPARKAALFDADNTDEFMAALNADTTPTAPATEEKPAVAHTTAAADTSDAVASTGTILTVCGNGLGTSLFLKNTLDDLLVRWGWNKHLTVEATDTISAKGKAKEADAILTSEAIAHALGDVGVPVRIIRDFTSMTEIDQAMRSLYVVE